MSCTPSVPSRHRLALAASLLCAAPAWSQQAPTAAPESLDTVVVTGMKASLSKAQDRKRNAEQIVDAIVADEIGKLPDANVAEALQRIAGVQISRDRGEGDRVQVRGLSQTQTLLNGRSIFTAGKERGLSFQDVPAELLAGADVYKTPTADQVEGGIAGLIDLRTRKPFDFAGAKFAATLKDTYADLARKSKPEGSVLASNRWQLGGGQQLGALVSLAKQKRAYRADTQELGAPAQLADGSGIYAPTGVWNAYELGSRDRTGVTAAVQYRPNADTEYALDLHHTRLKTKTDTYGFYGSPFWANWSATTNLGALWPNGSITKDTNGNLASGKFWGASMSTSAFVADNDTKTTQAALSGQWKVADWRVKSELGHTQSDFSRLYQEARLGFWTNTPGFAYDLTTELPSAYPVLGSPNDLLTPSQYWADKALYFKQENHGKETTWRLDGERRLDGLVSRLRTGLRVADRKATSAEINTINDLFSAAATGPVAGAAPGLASKIGVIAYDDLLKNAGAGNTPRQWLSVTDLGWLHDPATARAAMGLSVPAFDAAQTFDYREKTQAAYAVADLEGDVAGLPWSGNLGLRYVRTEGARHYTTADGVPASLKSSDNDWLPSANFRLDLTNRLIARVAASKVVTQPNFDQLTPSLSLNANDKTGYLGNPNLGALHARQFDLSLEYYLNNSDHVYGAAFHKRVDGFLQTTTRSLNYGGSTYTVSTPSNGADGSIKGLEIGYQAFFTRLPGWLRGLGLQANYTYVDSSAPGPINGQKTQLEGLSRDSFNIVGMYDDDAFSLRLAYNYRSNYIAGTSNYYPSNGTVIAQTPIILKGYGMLDAYASWALTPSLKLAVEANNLTRTVRHSQYGIGDLPRGTYADDRRYAVSLHLNF
ncbi:TonB-dependent receptor [Roseateles puraquae]|uniref:TonB-dependent receptor n=1 Tax=Roseateles puraquae TaxID=431059 RepID=UPI0031DAA68D